MRDEKTELRLRTKQYALQIIRLYEKLPAKTVAQVIGRQLLRSGTSVGANFREAHRARSTAEFISKLGDCLKELEETAYWLELLADAGVVAASAIAAPADETNQLTAILTSIVKKLKAKL
ncbi:MAG: four helix bundle protein [Verrucomicrobiota bacterium]